MRGKVLAKRIGDPDRTPSGLIIIPDTVKERSQKGMVQAVGKDVHDLEAGDAAVWQPWTEKLFRVGDELFAIVDEKVVEATLETYGTD